MVKTPSRAHAQLQTRGFPLAGMVVCALLVSAALPGCYERVIDAKGPNAGNANVQPGYRSETWLDRAVFPEADRSETSFGSSTADRQKAYMRQNAK